MTKRNRGAIKRENGSTELGKRTTKPVRLSTKRNRDATEPMS